MAGLDGINQTLAQRFLAMQAAARAAGLNIGVTSGYRTVEQQIALRRKNGCPDVWSSPASSCRVPTAIPGRSNHNRGFAIDISGNADAKAWVAQNAARFGLGLPVSGEDWHVELAGGDQAAQGYAAAGPMGFNLEWATEERTPEQEMDDRMDQLVQVIGGANQDALLESQTDLGLESPVAPELSGPEGELGTDVTTLPSGQEFTRLRQEATTIGAPGGGTFQGDIPPPGYAPAGQGVDRWRDVALAALRYTGQDAKWLPLLLKRMNQESGGNERIVNNWDSNAQRGDPSKGLMQNIGSAFAERARELAGRGIYDGFANIVASIRYTLDRYGTLAAWGRKGGY